jgi:hypothetical protein
VYAIRLAISIVLGDFNGTQKSASAFVRLLYAELTKYETRETVGAIVPNYHFVLKDSTEIEGIASV